MRHRPAPSASLISSSCARPAPRTNIRFATFAHEQHDAYRGEEDGERRSHGTDEHFDQWRRSSALAAVGVRILLRELFGDDGQFGLRRIELDSRFQTSDRNKTVVIPSGEHEMTGRIEVSERQEYVLLPCDREIAWQHADDRCRCVVEGDPCSNRRLIATEFALPERMADETHAPRVDRRLA
jgi:hypothetical protein